MCAHPHDVRSDTCFSHSVLAVRRRMWQARRCPQARPRREAASAYPHILRAMYSGNSAHIKPRASTALRSFPSHTPPGNSSGRLRPRACLRWQIVKVLVTHRLLCRDSLRWIILQHFVQQIKSFRLEIWTKLLELDGDPLLPLYLVNLKVRLVLRKLNLRDAITADGRDGQNGLGVGFRREVGVASQAKGAPCRARWFRLACRAT